MFCVNHFLDLNKVRFSTGPVKPQLIWSIHVYNRPQYQVSAKSVDLL